VDGWAADFQSTVGTGISAVEIWLDGQRLGQATYGQWRQDIADSWGARFGPCGFTYAWDTRNVADGNYALQIRSLSRCGWKITARRAVTVRNSCQITLNIDSPQAGATVAGEFDIAGWAADLRSTSGTGIDRVSIWLDGAMGQGTHLGDITAFLPRPDIEAVLGPNFRDCGYSFRWTTALMTLGPHTLYVYAHSPICDWHGPVTRGFTASAPLTPTPTPTSTPTRTPTPTPLPAEQLIIDPGFELQHPAWYILPTRYQAGYATERRYEGLYSMRAGIVYGPDLGQDSYSSFQQTITLPSDIRRAVWSCYYYPITSDSLADHQYWLVMWGDGNYMWADKLLQNLQQWTRWPDYSLLPWAGQTITLRMGVYNDGDGRLTAMYVDNVTVIIERFGSSQVEVIHFTPGSEGGDTLPPGYPLSENELQ